MLASPRNGIGPHAPALVEANGRAAGDNQAAAATHVQARDMEGKDKKKKEDWTAVLVGKQDKGTPKTAGSHQWHNMVHCANEWYPLVDCIVCSPRSCLDTARALLV